MTGAAVLQQAQPLPLTTNRTIQLRTRR